MGTKTRLKRLHGELLFGFQLGQLFALRPDLVAEGFLPGFGRLHERPAVPKVLARHGFQVVGYGQGDRCLGTLFRTLQNYFTIFKSTGPVTSSKNKIKSANAFKIDVFETYFMVKYSKYFCCRHFTRYFTST